MQTITPQPHEIWTVHKQIVKYVSKYIIPFAFGYGPDHHNYNYNSATTTLLDLGKGPLALTCEHVVRRFRQFKESQENKINPELYIGGATGINRKIIAWDEDLDIATLQLINDDLTLIPYNQDLCGTQFINEIYTGPIKENDVIVFAGFPSQSDWRYKTKNSNLTTFHPCICFAEVVSTNDDKDQIICQSDYRVYEREFSDKLILTDDPTGMSGGAAFLAQQKGNNLSLSFFGIVSDGKFIEKNCLTAYIKRVKRLNSDGTIKEAVI